MTLFFDTREPDPHPWERHLPEGVEDSARHTGNGRHRPRSDSRGRGDQAQDTFRPRSGCIGASRERFERELRRGRYFRRFLIVAEGTLGDVQRSARGIHPNSVNDSLASWAVRFCPIIFAGSTAGAADFGFRALAAQVRDIQRPAQSLREEPSAPMSLSTQQTRHSGRTAQKPSQ
jgi:hypothetical protein